ncbi:hypothetical protein HY612_05810 [Candidatus Roizmanbacteria bacterium]|nr:hypothetical protein [Candidatus Roizmanbacteria bacterium]
MAELLEAPTNAAIIAARGAHYAAYAVGGHCIVDFACVGLLALHEFAGLALPPKALEVLPYVVTAELGIIAVSLVNFVRRVDNFISIIKK